MKIFFRCLFFYFICFLSFKPAFAENRHNFIFPKDHASHPDYKMEWWYVTAQLQSGDGEKFGLQWTVFRVTEPEKIENKNGVCNWCLGQILFGHAAVSDLSQKKFYYDQSISRELKDIAWASSQSFNVALPRYQGFTQGNIWVLENHNHQFSYRLELNLNSLKPVLHGEKGYARKSNEKGVASYYYSVPHIPIQAVLSLEGKEKKLSGKAWLDHEFSSSQLSQSQKGWDWFGIHLKGKSALMLYQLRDVLEAKQNYLFATLIDEDGKVYDVLKEDIQLNPLEIWKSKSGANYPIRWRIQIKKYQVDLEVEAIFPTQELNTLETSRLIYWEGATQVKGLFWGKDSFGEGYLEMTGYSESLKKNKVL